MFVYDGGTLVDDPAIQLPADELRSFRFVAAEEIGRLMSSGLARRIRSAVRAQDEGITIEIVNGMIVYTEQGWGLGDPDSVGAAQNRP
ncbi:MAG: hypothetical protein M3457_23295 [Chloroflexota bacterium]|nr:hypothetical protein [Chloroflexota bacterium]